MNLIKNQNSESSCIEVVSLNLSCIFVNMPPQLFCEQFCHNLHEIYSSFTQLSCIIPLEINFCNNKICLGGLVFFCMIFSFNIKKYWDFVINFIGETTQTLRIFSLSCLKKITSFSSPPYCPGISCLKQADGHKIFNFLWLTCAQEATPKIRLLHQLVHKLRHHRIISVFSSLLFHIWTFHIILKWSIF